jgi:hypothetical protein
MPSLVFSWRVAPHLVPDLFKIRPAKRKVESEYTKLKIISKKCLYQNRDSMLLLADLIWWSQFSHDLVTLFCNDRNRSDSYSAIPFENRMNSQFS